MPCTIPVNGSIIPSLKIFPILTAKFCQFSSFSQYRIDIKKLVRIATPIGLAQLRSNWHGLRGCDYGRGRVELS